MSYRTAFAVLAVLIQCSLFGVPDPWVMDQGNSSMRFSVNHMRISEINGEFQDFFASTDMDPGSILNAEFNIVAHVASIDTGLEMRDKHLRGEEFLNTEKYPKLRFHGANPRHVAGNQYEVDGELTIKEVTKPITVTLTYGGMVEDFWGNRRIGLKFVGVFSRYDFGLAWSEVLEAGGLIVGENVNVFVNLEFFQQKGAHDLAL